MQVPSIFMIYNSQYTIVIHNTLYSWSADLYSGFWLIFYIPVNNVSGMSGCFPEYWAKDTKPTVFIKTHLTIHTDNTIRMGCPL